MAISEIGGDLICWAIDYIFYLLNVDYIKVYNSNYFEILYYICPRKPNNMSEELLITNVGKLRNLLHRVLKLQFAAEADVKLTIEEFILLNMIEVHTDQILQNIAIATGKNKSVVMRMIDSLEQKGLARRTVNPDDRRENLLSITERGAEVLSQYKEIEKRVSAELLSGIPADKIACFFEVADAVSRKARGK